MNKLSFENHLSHFVKEGACRNMDSKVLAFFFIFLIFSMMGLPLTYGCGYCPPYHHHPSPPKSSHPPPKTSHPPHHGPPKVSPPSTKPPGIIPPITLPPPVTNPPGIIPPIINPPGIIPPIINPPGILPPPSSTYPPSPPSSCHKPPGVGSCPPATCPINALKLGLCVDVLGGLVHIGIGNPIENACCPVLQGLLELEAAICLCTTIRLKLLNLNIFIPLALQVLITCGLTPPPASQPEYINFSLLVD